MKIFLLGFMGCGKSYVGQRLATAFNWNFIDLDDKIVEMAGKTIPEIFETEGENAFRIWEQKALHNLKDDEKSIISLGGGTPCFFDNMNWVNENGISVFLDCSIEVLVNRLKKETETRPLLAGKTKKELSGFIENKLSDRRLFYEQAQLVYLLEKGNEKVVVELVGFFKRLAGD